MDQTLTLKGKIYISSKRAAYFSGFAKDYVAEMLRSGKIEGTKVSRNWYVSQNSLLDYLKNHDADRYEKFKNKLGAENEEGLGDLKTELPVKEVKDNQPIIFQIPAPVMPMAGVASMSHGASKSILSSSFGSVVFSSVVASFAFLFLAVAFFANDLNIKMPKNLQALFFNAQESGVANLPTYKQSQNLLSQGMVVMPQVGTDSQAQLEAVKETFSDEVKVTPDESGTSGVITPVFKERTGNDYLYVLVPVKEDNKNN